MTRFDASVVIPTRNRPRLVRRAVRSMLDQRNVAIEVIVVDDGSSLPLTLDLNGEFDDRQHRVYVLRNHRREGVASARNRGLQAASGPWVGFCDDDDLWAPGKVYEQLEAVDGQGRWVCSGSANLDHDLTIRSFPRFPPDGDVHRTMLEGNVMAGGASNVMAQTAWFRDLGGFDPSLSTLADWEAWIRLSAVGPLHVVPRYHVAYVSHPEAMSLDVPLLWSDLAKLLRKHRDDYSRHGVVHDLPKWREYVVRQLLRRGDWSEAARESALLAREGPARAVLRTIGRAIDTVLPKSEARHRATLHLRPSAESANIAEAEGWLAAHRDPRW